MRSKRLVTTGGHYAFLKISEGCNKRCTYCIIPSLRGPYPQRADGAASRRGKGAGGSGRAGTDSCRTGDDAFTAWTCTERRPCRNFYMKLAQDRRNRMDPYPVLLSGGDHRGADSGVSRTEGKSLSLPGSFQSSTRAMPDSASGWDAARTQAELRERIAQSAGRDPGYCTAHDLDFRFPG